MRIDIQASIRREVILVFDLPAFYFKPAKFPTKLQVLLLSKLGPYLMTFIFVGSVMVLI